MNLVILYLFVMFYNVNAYFNGEKINVGSVLFKKSDANKRCWDATSINMLEARTHLQNILPSPNLVNSINDEYLDHLLRYFDHSYDVVKRETDPETRNVMKYALSDAIGGYLKSWVLPVSKYSYYGGSISLDNVLKVNKLYDDIKKELNTNGEGWRKDEELINYFPIDVVDVKRRNSRNNEGTCDDLTYFEKSDSGYAVPVPVINWDICPSTMFMPLKTPSLVPLECTNSSTSLANYYELIQNCVNNFDNWKDFDDRFQSWLMTDVAPHLSDDCLYVPFGGVLGLMNHSKLPGNFFKSLKSGYNKIINSCNSNTFFLFSGKKVIIAIIIFVELVWCIPALYYVICCKKKKRKRRWNLLFCFKKKNKKDAYYLGTTDDDTDSDIHYLSSSSDRSYNTMNLQPSIYGTRYSTDSAFSRQNIPYIDDRRTESKPLIKSQSKTKPISRDVIETECEVDRKKSISKSKSRQSHKSNKGALSSEKVLQNFDYSQYLMKAKTKEASVGETLEINHTGTAGYRNNSQPLSQKLLKESSKGIVNKALTHNEENCKTLQHPCTNNIIADTNAYNTKPITPKKKEKKIFRIRKRTTEIRRQENAVNNGKNVPIRKETAPTLHINIAQPETEIKVGISRYKEYTEKIVRPSKIPRFNAAGIKEVGEKPTYLIPKRIPPHWLKAEKAFENDVDTELQEKDAEKLNVTL